MKPTAEQQAALDAFQTGENMVIEAGAGTGKTTTLKLMGKGTNDRGVYIAYNAAIAAEAKASFPRNVQCATAHSFAYRALGYKYKDRLFKARWMNGSQSAAYLRINEGVKIGELAGEDVYLSPAKLANLARQTVLRFCYSTDQEIEPRHMPRVNGVDDSDAHWELARFITPYAKKAWDMMLDVNHSFGWNKAHDVYLKAWILTNPELPGDFILYDEAQDANRATAGLVLAQKNSQLIAVGDQCQPTGTMILTPDRGKVPIEQINKGDLVVSYDISKSYLRRSGSHVLGITKRPVDEEMILVNCADHESRYTRNHHCVVRMMPAFENKWVLYVMRREDDYRIGICPGIYASQGNRCGFMVRCLQEDADAIWVLDAFKTRNEAVMQEQIASNKYNIPQLIFNVTNGSVMTQTEIDMIWEVIGDNYKQAKKLLRAHNRSINYPLWQYGHERMLARRATVIHAVNLMDGMLMLPVEGAMDALGKRAVRNLWQPIRVRFDSYEGDVYSMEVERDHTYIADGIITHNCQAIYGWRGAEDAMQSWPAQHRLVLSQSFRFGPAVAEEANKWLELLDAPLRLTGFDKLDSQVAVLLEPDAILCRTNATVIAEAMRAQEAGKRIAVEGGTDEIARFAKGVQALQAGQSTEHPELAAFKTWQQVKEFVEEDGASDLKVIVSLIETYGVESVIKVADSAVDDQKFADIVLSTAHKSKGREWGKVRIANDFRDPTEPDPTTGETREFNRSEGMLAYVSVTRAMKVLDCAGLSWVDTLLEEKTGKKPAVLGTPAPTAVKQGCIAKARRKKRETVA